MIQINATIQGLQEAQDANLRVIAALDPAGPLEQATRWVLVGAHRYLVTITHVDTGAYRASHRMELEGTRGEIFVDPSARNPQTGKRVRSYAIYEEKRGGSHAAYGRTVDEVGVRLVQEGQNIILRSLP
jgi:hypothetical protein